MTTSNRVRGTFSATPGKNYLGVVNRNPAGSRGGLSSIASWIPGSVLDTNSVRNTGSVRDQFPDRFGSGNIGTVIDIPEKEPEKDPYMEMYDAYASRLEGMSAAQKAAAEARYKETLGLLNSNYDRSANYAYVNYKQGQKALPEDLSNMGITGGASESAGIKLQNAYGANLANNEYSRGNDLAKARGNYDSALNGVDADLNAQLADAYANFSQQSLAYNQEKKEKAEAKAEAARLKAEQDELDARNLKMRMNELARQGEGKNTVNYTDPNTGKYHYLVTPKNTKDAKAFTNALNDELRRAQKLADAGYSSSIKVVNGIPVAVPTGKKKLTSSGSGGTYSGYSGGGSNSPTDVPGDNGGKGKTKKKNTYNEYKVSNYVLTNAAKMLSDPEAVVKDLDKKKKSGQLTTKEANMIYLRMPKKR